MVLEQIIKKTFRFKFNLKNSKKLEGVHTVQMMNVPVNTIKTNKI